MGSVDVYRITDTLDDPTLEVLVTRLESRGRHPRFIAMMNEYFDAMKIESARSVLDLGCGTGIAARAIAHRKAFLGHVTGVDMSPYLVAEAKRLADEEGLTSSIEFRTGDSQRLELPDASFDSAVAHTLVSHVPEPIAVLRELARIVKPGGSIAIFDGDYASLTFGSDDPVKGKEDDETIIDAIVTNPRVMRQMPNCYVRPAWSSPRRSHTSLRTSGRRTFGRPRFSRFCAFFPRQAPWPRAMLRHGWMPWSSVPIKASFSAPATTTVTWPCGGESAQ